MDNGYALLVGTVGHGLFRSTDGGETFAWVNKGISCNEVTVRGFAADPRNPQHILMGTATFESGRPELGTPYGLHETHDGGETWSPIEAFKGIECWRITFDPKDPDRFYVGTRPANLYCTEDGGKSFEKLDTPFAQTCRGIGWPRITSINIHPEDTDFLFVSIEIGGFYRSTDRGKTWERVLDDIDLAPPNGAVFGEGGREDGHYSVISVSEPEMVIASTPDGAYKSYDRGRSWEYFPVLQEFSSQYHHDLAIRPDDPDTLFYGVGDHTVGSHGAMLISRDRGETWSTADFPEPCNAPIWCFAQHPSDTDRVFACTHYGMVYQSEDGGASWAKIPREFTEIRAVCWVPNS